MARNRQKAKQRKAQREANAAKSGAPAAGAGAPPQDEGQVDAQATADVVEVTKRVVKSSGNDQSKAAKKPKEAKAPREKGRFRTFLRSSWAELKRVQWPDRQQLTTMTGIVIGFVFVAGAYLGAIDQVAKRFVDFIIF